MLNGAEYILSEKHASIVQFEVNKGAYEANGVTPAKVLGKFTEHGYKVYFIQNGGLEKVSDESWLNNKEETINLFAFLEAHEQRFKNAVEKSYQRN